MKLVAALKLLPTPEQAAYLTATLARCNEAATWLAMSGHGNGIFGQFALHKMAYADLRQRFGLTAQAAVRCIAKVADAFKVNRKTAPVFRPDAAQPYDDRILRFVNGSNAVSLWTLAGRIVVPVAMGDHQRRLMAYRKGEADLCLVRGKWFLAATCDVPETEPFDAEDWLGVDVGIVSLATDSDGKSYSGEVMTPLEPKMHPAYVAGLFDGEGCISMSRREKSGRYRMRIAIAGAYRHTLVEIQQLYGGGVRATGCGTLKTVFCLYIDKLVDCQAFLKVVRPYLREKAAQADVALIYLEQRLSMSIGPGGASVCKNMDAISCEVFTELRRLKTAEHFMAPEVLAA